MNLNNKDYQVLSDFFRWFVPEGLKSYNKIMIDNETMEN